MRNFRLLTLVSALVFVGSGITSPVMTIYLESLGASFAEISLILTSFALTSLVVSYFAGRWSDRLAGRKLLLAGGLILTAIAYVWLGRVPNATLAWPVRIVEGVGAGIYGALSLAMMGDLLEDSARRGRSMGFFRGIGSLSFAAGAVAGGWFATQYSRPAVFLLAAGCFLASGVVALFVTEPHRGRGQARGHALLVDPAPVESAVAPVAEPGLEVLPLELPDPAPASDNPAPATGAPSGYPVRSFGLPGLFLAGVVLWTAAIGALASMWPNAMSHLGYSQQAISTLWGLAALIEMPSMQLAGMVSDNIGRAPVLAVGGFGVAFVVIGYALVAQWLPALIGLQVVRGAAYSSYTATAMTFAAERGDKRNRGSITGVYTAFTGAGQLLGTLAGGFIVQAFGFTVMFVACAVVATFAGFCFLALPRGKAPALASTPAPTPDPIPASAPTLPASAKES